MEQHLFLSLREKRSVVMHNIEYLTERDLKYFEKKEALGEAIIIRIEPAFLLSLDLDELFREQKKDQTLSAEELKEFLHIGQKRSAGQAKEDKPSEEKTLTGIEKNLQHINLSEDQRQVLMQLISSGASDEELMGIIGAGDDHFRNRKIPEDAGHYGEIGG